METGLTVFVVDSDLESRTVVKKLAQEMGLPCRDFASGREFLDAYDSAWYGCVILELRIPDVGGLQIQQQLSRKGGTLPVIFLTEHADVPSAVRAMRAGAVQFLKKPPIPNELWDAIQEAIILARERREALGHYQNMKERIARLTPKERSVLELIADGKSNREISEEIGLSLRTIEVRRVKIMKKLGVESAMDFVEFIDLLEAEKEGEFPHLNSYLRRWVTLLAEDQQPSILPLGVLGGNHRQRTGS